MKYIATFDIGTTAVKGVLISESGNVILSKSETIETIFIGDFVEQRPNDWFEAFCRISKIFTTEKPAIEIGAIIMSGQMQDLILVGNDGFPTTNAILYSDARASDQAKKISQAIGEEKIFATTMNRFDGSIPFAKLLWVKENLPHIYDALHKILISSKDYVIYRLTGNFVADVVAGSTAGLMDIREKKWIGSWCKIFNIDPALLPDLYYSEECAGSITETASTYCGYLTGTPVYVGSGDAGATTLASGIFENGEFNINLGTSGWVACVSDSPMPKESVFNLAAIPRDLYINVVPFYNAGNVHQWICSVMANDGMKDEMYAYGNKLLAGSEPGSGSVMFLPYLVGERFPVIDTEIKGAYVGITPETTKQDLIRAALEGVAFSIRQGLNVIGKTPKTISLIGGGAQVKIWCQIFADMLNQEILVFPNSEYLPAMALSSCVLTAQGKISDYSAFTESLNNMQLCERYTPDENAVKIYDNIYGQYLRIYPAVKTI